MGFIYVAKNSRIFVTAEKLNEQDVSWSLAIWNNENFEAENPY